MPGSATETNQVDETTWTATIRSDAEWHDGEPFPPDDVDFTYRYYRDGSPPRYTHRVSEAPQTKRINAGDEQTVRFECAYPCPTLADITFADLPIIPKHTLGTLHCPQKW